jgi:Xaa-Pro aminopeptidase
MEKVYNTVLDAQVTAIKAARAGMEGRELDAVARNVIAEAGYGEYFSHSLSHGLGIDVHEAPSCSTSATGILPAGAVISMEPGIYIPGKFGVRIEDVIYLTETGCEDITDLPKELTVICK